MKPDDELPELDPLRDFRASTLEFFRRAEEHRRWLENLSRDKYLWTAVIIDLMADVFLAIQRHCSRLIAIRGICDLVESFGCIYPKDFREKNWDLATSALVKDILTWRKKHRSRTFRAWVYLCLIIRALFLISDSLRVFGINRVGKMVTPLWNLWTRK